MRPALGPNVARFGYGTLLVAATAMAAVALGVTPLLHTFWPLVLASGLMGISTGVTQPATMSMMAEAVGADFWGLAMGIRQVAQRSASVLSPIVFGVIIAVSKASRPRFTSRPAALAGAVPIVGSPDPAVSAGRRGRSAPPTRSSARAAQGPAALPQKRRESSRGLPQRWPQMDDLNALKRKVRGTVDELRAEFVSLSRRIHETPELGMQERQAAQWPDRNVAGRRSSTVTQPIAGMETAFRADVPGAAARPHVALLAEYDALAGVGHACGHNLICMASVGAAVALHRAIPRLAGVLTVLGTPAEETAGGKVLP